MKPKTLRVFVTHTNIDNFRSGSFYKVAKELLEDLHLEAHIEEMDPNPGRLREKILEGLANSDYHLVLLTPASVERPWVNFELGAAYTGLGSSIKDFPRTKVEERIILLAESPAVFDKASVVVDKGMKFYYWSALGRRPKKQAEVWFWPGTFRNSKIRGGLGRLLLEHTFRGKNRHRLGHGIRRPVGMFQSRGHYESWLRSFGAWAPSRLFAVSRQPLMYWLRRGQEYRETLRENIRQDRLDVERLSLWSRSSDLVSSLSARDQNYLWNAVGRQGSPKYSCDLCATYDLLWLFLTNCHSSSRNAYYAFREATRYLPWSHRFREMLVYEEKYILLLKADRTLRYVLDIKHADCEAVKVQEFVQRVANNNADRGSVAVKYGWRFRSSGRVRDLISSLEHFHEQKKGRGACGFALKPPRVSLKFR